jgi:hypothetical protein
MSLIYFMDLFLDLKLVLRKWCSLLAIFGFIVASKLDYVVVAY